MTGHQAFDEALAAYALDALPDDERAAFEVHLATCAACQAELAELRTVTGALGALVEPIEPPPGLKARTIAGAVGSGRPSSAPAMAPPPAPASGTAGPGWLPLAAAIVFAAALGFYAWTLQGRVTELEALVAQASSQVETLRTELAGLRTDRTTLVRTVNVLGSPDVVRLPLAGQGAALSARGAAYWSPTAGLVLSAEGLPALSPDRVYQLWVIRPGAAAPASAGFLAMGQSGTAMFSSAAPELLTAPATVAVTNEPAGGSPGPTTEVLLIGS